MKVSVTSRGTRLKRVLAGGVVSATMGVALVAGPVATSSASASMSPFCKTLTTFHPKSPPGTGYMAYRTWAKTYLPFFQKLASEAPNASTKSVLTAMVQIIQHESNFTSDKAFAAYVATHNGTWTKGWKSFASAVMSCVTSLY